MAWGVWGGGVFNLGHGLNGAALHLVDVDPHIVPRVLQHPGQLHHDRLR